MFPGPYASIIRNEEGEPIGWNNHYPGEEEEPRYEMMEQEQDREEEEVWCDECDSYHFQDEDCQEEDIALAKESPGAN